MTQPPRTIDNLGVDVSTRYAEDQAAFNEALIIDARTVPVQAGIEVTAPYIASEMDALLHILPTHVTWASFIAPPLYFEQRKRLFTFQLIPSMGSDDKKESQALKILSKLSEKGETVGTDKRQRFEEEREFEAEQREQKILSSLLNTIALYDKLIIEINSRRTQYQKG